ncbi:GbsR/MarR family transcriptional regulator [Dichotomicrobium thermohalophilum]|uniref:HTH-type transcriptional regulator n=1 Tax=Dichotomicrobium thermohalophilum TaxID=933063 RepID=A0A397PBY1_9HYPH|nr:winged helix-turn-helix transcriptional regulator [Dichotomicrobium thermohalophilum]RIA45439.1 DNA-binding transcriptional regulator GbsR (MarR family) [Dichotomicrobium thermohalophilum]
MTLAKDKLDRFVDRMGLVAEADGLSRIAGRIMGLMVLEGGPLSFSEIAERLDISRASVSTNTRFLERIGVIERVTVKGSRQDHFQLAKAPYARLLEGSVARIKKAQGVVADAKAEVSPEDNERRQRLDELGAFYATLAETFEELVARFDDQR